MIKVLRNWISRSRIHRYERSRTLKAAADRRGTDRLDWAREGTHLHM